MHEDALPANWRIDSLYVQCNECHDGVDLVVYVRRHPERMTRMRLEPTQDAIARNGVITHRPGHCGGQMTAYTSGHAFQVQLDDCRRPDLSRTTVGA